MEDMYLFLDTDIGTDVDDALALGVILGSPEVTLVGISTVYGDTLLRARLASKLARLADPTFAVPIAAGESATRSGRPVWWPGHEGQLFDDLEIEPTSPVGGVELLVVAAAKHPGELILLAVGPLTNVAAALDADPGFEHNLKRVVIMGGDFTEHNRVAEHNFLSDVAAAQRVFDSDLPIVIGGLDLTMQISVGPDDVERIAAAGDFGSALQAEIAEWWKFHGQKWNTPHDPILALWLLEPHLFRSVRSDVSISADGVSHNHPNPDGRVEILISMDVADVVAGMIDRICAAAGRHPSTVH